MSNHKGKHRKHPTDLESRMLRMTRESYDKWARRKGLDPDLLSTRRAFEDLQVGRHARP